MKTIITLFLLLSSNAFANFTANWTGQGEMTDGETSILCQSMKIDIVHDDSTISLKKVSYECDSTKVSFENMNMDIAEGSLMFQGQKIGSISEQDLFIEIIDQENDAKTTIHLTKENDELRLIQDFYIENMDEPLMIFKGRLNK